MTAPSATERESVRAFLRATTPEQIAEFILKADATQERALRTYLGDDRFHSLYVLAQKLGPSRGLRGPSRNVVVLPGIMGSEMTVADAAQNQTLVWLSYWYIYRGWLDRLQLDADGESPYDPAYTTRASNVLVKYYGELLLRLAQNYKARAFWYDWRKNMARSATDLEHFIRTEFLDDSVTLIAHSMGGLVARTLLLKAPTTENGQPLIDRLIMLGTPNLGSFEVPQILAGIQDDVRLLAKLVGGVTGLLHPDRALQHLLEILDSFPSVYEMTPWPKAVAENPELIEQLYSPGTYAAFNSGVSGEHFATSKQNIERLNGCIGAKDRLVYVAGCGQKTVVGVNSIDDLSDLDSYQVSLAGDGRVPHALGVLPDVPAYYVRCAHGDLARNAEVLNAIDDLVENGQTGKLPSQVPEDRAVMAITGVGLHEEWKAERRNREKEEDEAIADLLRRLDRQAAASRGGEISAPPAEVSSAERELEDRLAASFLGSPPLPTAATPARPVSGRLPSITVKLVHDDIATCQDRLLDPPLDAIAGGIYTGVRPWGAVRALDESISAALQLRPDATTQSDGEESGLLISDMIQRGAARGDLGVPLVLPDPRDATGQRIIILAGLGPAGRCGVPELAPTVREMFWSVNRLGKRHLAMLLIGAGAGNLDEREAVEGLLQGIARALGGMQTDDGPAVLHTLTRLTLVEKDGRRLTAIAEALNSVGKQLRDQNLLDIDFTATSDDFQTFARIARETEKQKLEEKLQRLQKEPDQQPTRVSQDPVPTCVTFAMDKEGYTFGAVTAEAAIPERSVDVNTQLVEMTNDSLVAAEDLDEQNRLGRVLGRLLIPEDLTNEFKPAVPLVMQVDAQSARVHWEMVVPDTGVAAAADAFSPSALGQARGFTRQLRTAYAPPPEPPPAARRTLRALIVADPAPDARLPGAFQEAAEVAALFETFNQVYQDQVRVEVVRLFGPSEAQPIKVLEQLFLERFDLLHFAGHCFFNKDDPAGSGWLFQFNPPLVLSARELRRCDHVPRFVCSNACESGVTPDRPENRNAALAPSFAEVFFERGVANFVCTAWPVDDLGARLFARTLYAALLGLELDAGRADVAVTGPRPPERMYVAMQEARRAVAAARSGRRTWGAYQHYGNPHARFFAPDISRSARPHFAAHAKKAAPNGGPAPSDSDPLDAARRAAQANEARLRSFAGVIDVRPGFEYKDGWSTGKPAVVVVVEQKLAGSALRPEQRLPETVDGVPVDVTTATPHEQIAARGLRGESVPALAEAEPLLRPGETMTPVEAVAERGREPYHPPAGVPLNEVSDAMKVLCHVSPDQGWPTLSDFLNGTKDTLTVGMYDFTATHIVDKVKEDLKPARRNLQLVLDPGLALGNGGDDGNNPKANDVTEDEVRTDLEKTLKNRFQFAWAAVTHKGKTTGGIFPTSYHIKVAVRDHDAFWLSSGNWQSSNQPGDETLKMLHASWDKPASVLTVCNREWHVVMSHPGLADTYEKYLQNDFKEALRFQDGERGMPIPAAPMPDLLVPVMPEELERLRGNPLHRFDARTFTFTRQKPLRVQPLLTPDNYVDHVLKLIQSAKKSVYFQNQYINLTAKPDKRFVALLDALKKAVNDPKIDVRVIVRQLPNTRQQLEALESYGFNMNRFRVQASTHTKGIIVDGKTVCLGSHNWSSYGTTLNRDASLIFFDEGIAAYYQAVFLHDWDGLAHPKVLAEHAMPRLASGTRGEPTPEGMIRIPWATMYED
jgi:pimeloyl-ACP methyl ester carboxylesterase